MTTKTLTFVQISDSRFSGSASKLEALSNDVQEALSALPGVTVQTDEPGHITFSQARLDGESNAWGEIQSWRQRFYVQKTGRKTSWNDIYKAVNGVKAAPYEFIRRPAFS